MSRTPAAYSMTVVRGATWEDELTYTDEAGAAVDLTGYQARMQVRTMAGRYGTSTTDTLLLELTTANGLLVIATPVGGTVPNQIRIAATSEAHAALNPSNAKRAKYAYSIELYIPADVGAGTPEYAIPLVEGSIVVKGEVTR